MKDIPTAFPQKKLFAAILSFTPARSVGFPVSCTKGLRHTSLIAQDNSKVV